MSGTSTDACHLQACIDRLLAGHGDARNDLVQCACARLTRLTRKMLRDFPGVRRWEETDDVFQNAALRLCAALKEVTPRTVPEFIRLAALQIRRELLDLARHYYGPEGHGAHHASNSVPADSASRHTPGRFEPMQSTYDPARLAMWTEFHDRVHALPDDDREAFDLLWYQGLSQAEAAALLGVTERTIQRRWQQARLSIHKAMKGNLPM
jgi:RNA polymerase sigma-70 factor (ECF subfamily)